MIRQTVGLNEFVRRQVAGSGKTYFQGKTFEDVAHHAEERLNAGNYQPGYRDGVVLVSAAREWIGYFHCPYVKITSRTKLKAEWVFRQAGEEPYIRLRARNGDPLPAGKVDFILYRQNVLAENKENSTDCDWELISIHALPEGLEAMPMHPVTMMRNQLKLPGGTAANYSSAEWAEAVRFWQNYAALEPETI
ncbi:MAG: DUF3228 family protein [FCB group bacterium]|nr:DUF3228 family protein [FCB group bacterium]